MITSSHVEYQRLQEELMARIEKAQNQSLVVCSLLFVFLMALTNLVWLAYQHFTEFRDYEVSFFFFSLIISLTLLPVFILTAFSAKYYDNISGIRLVSIYVMIFHEIPSIINSQKSKKDAEIFGWETLHESVLKNKKIRNAIGVEYYASAIIFIIAAFLFYIIAHIVIGKSFSYSHILPKFDVVVVVSIGTVGLWSLKQIRMHTNIDQLFEDNNSIVVNLLDKAIEIGLIRKKDLHTAMLYLMKNNKKTF